MAFMNVASRLGRESISATIAAYQGPGSRVTSAEPRPPESANSGLTVGTAKYLGTVGQQWERRDPGAVPIFEAEAHQDHRGSLARFFVSTLAGPLDAYETEVIMERQNPPGEGALYDLPVLPERMKGYYGSGNISEMVEWIKIDDEIMRLDAIVSEKAGLLAVKRGYKGSTPAPHARGSAIISPVFLAEGRNRARPRDVPREEGGTGQDLVRDEKGAAVDPPRLRRPVQHGFEYSDPNRWRSRAHLGSPS